MMRGGSDRRHFKIVQSEYMSEEAGLSEVMPWLYPRGLRPVMLQPTSGE